MSWVLDAACWRVWCWRRCHHKDVLWCAVTWRFRAWVWMHQIVGRGFEGRLARGWGVKGLQELGKLDIDFFECPDGLAQLAETIRAVVQWLVSVSLMHLVVIVIVDERGCSAGLREGVGNQFLEFSAIVVPFLKKGGGQHHVLWFSLVGEVVVIIVE